MTFAMQPRCLLGKHSERAPVPTDLERHLTTLRAVKAAREAYPGIHHLLPDDGHSTPPALIFNQESINARLRESGISKEGK